MNNGNYWLRNYKKERRDIASSARIKRGKTTCLIPNVSYLKLIIKTVDLVINGSYHP